MKSWSSLLKRLDLLAIGLQSRSRFQKRDGLSIVAAETAQTGAEFGIINSGFLPPNSMVTLTCSFWKSCVDMLIEVDVCKTVANDVCLQRGDSHGDILFRRMNL